MPRRKALLSVHRANLAGITAVLKLGVIAEATVGTGNSEHALLPIGPKPQSVFVKAVVPFKPIQREVSDQRMLFFMR